VPVPVLVPVLAALLAALMAQVTLLRRSAALLRSWP
jgi:hypothetical protein